MLGHVNNISTLSRGNSQCKQVTERWEGGRFKWLALQLLLSLAFLLVQTGGHKYLVNIEMWVCNMVKRGIKTFERVLESMLK